MITAKEYREITQGKDPAGIITESKELIEDKIVDAVLDGQKCCWLGFKASTEAVAWLESLGYIVRIERITRTEKDYDTRIMW